MRCDIVINSCLRDLHWLFYCLRLLQKNWKEDSRIIVRVEEDCRETLESWAFEKVEFYYVKPWPDTYCFQMYQKMVSDDYTDAELVMLVDSDLMLVEPTDLNYFTENGLPLVYCEEWSAHSSPVAEKAWRQCTSAVMGLDLDKDYMVSPPFLYWRETFSNTRQRIVRTIGKAFFDAVYSDHPFDYRLFMDHPMKFADFEALGLQAAKFEPDRYRVRSLGERKNPYPFRLYWSYQPFGCEVEAELKSLLAKS